jgi:mono/diheme cytochrome c family protein
MNRGPTSKFAAIGLAVFMLVALSACRGSTHEKPPIHPNWNMDNVQRYDPQEPSPFFADGRAMRPPVAGTVPYGELRADEHYYTGTQSGGLATELPDQIELSEALLERGQDRYGIYCQPCHGSAGYSDGVVVSRGLIQPPSFHDAAIRHKPLGHFFDVITNGVSTMPAYAAQIPVEDRWAIVAYIRALQVSQVASLE